MKRPEKRRAALLAAACLLLGLLAGCGKKNDAQQLSANVYVPRYLDLDLDLDYVRSGCTDGENLYIIGQTGRETTETDPISGETYTNWTYSYDIYRISLDKGEAEKLPGYEGPSIPEGRSGDAYIEDISIAADGTLWVKEVTYIWGYSDIKYPELDGDFGVDWAEPAEAEADDDGGAEALDEAADMDIVVEEPVYYENEEIVVRRHLDAQGNELEQMDLSGLEEALADVLEDAYIRSTVFDRDGNLYAMTGDKIYVLDSQLNVKFAVEGQDMWYDLIQLGDGTMGMRQWEYDEASETSINKLRTIDPEKQDWGTEYLLPTNVYSFYPGGGEYLFYYQVNDSVMGFKAGEPDGDGAGTGEGERLFSWVEADINRDNMRSFFFLPDGRIAAILQEWDENYEKSQNSVVVLTSTPRDQLPEKTTLVYATLYLNYGARNQIIDFNKKSDSYRIEVRDYAEYDTDSTGSAALQKLNTEILAGSVPDILDTTSLPIRQYGARGILEDLWPFIEKDPDLGRDALMTRPLEANEQDGKLYEIFSNFSIRSVAGPAGAVGDRMSWTLADLRAALEQMPEGCSIFGVSSTRDYMLNTILAQNMDQFVDWSTGKCSFDSDEFKALLSFCAEFPAEFSWENVDWDEWEDEEARILRGKQMLMETYVSGLDWTIQYLAAIFRNDYSFIGFPKEDGSVGSSFTYSRGIAMTSSCRDKEGAWSFLRQTLLPQTEGGERYYGSFPINKYDFDKLVDQALNPPEYELDSEGNPYLDEEGNPIPVEYGSFWIDDGTEIPLSAPTKEDVDKVLALYEAVSAINRYDEKIYNSVQEVAGQFFAGDKPLDDAAKLIQSKVSLYVNESR
ncbi:MAG: hypothetical protein HDT14_00160 [Oscillibacter sp.]|nr:hypothetical protein [Oscillibacter sp.]